MAERKVCRNADKYARTRPCDGKDGQVEQNFRILYDKAGDEDLAPVVQDTAGGADADEREFSRLLQEGHGREAEEGACRTVHKGIDAARESRR